MPKGVEHTIGILSDFASFLVIHSKMPKGVEHIQHTGDIDAVFLVIHSKMPKGVEHISMHLIVIGQQL